MANIPFEILAAIYVIIGFFLGLHEARKSRAELRKQGVEDRLSPTVLLLTVCWPLFYASRIVFWLLVLWGMAATLRTDKPERAK